MLVKPLSEAPEPVMQALERARAALQQAVTAVDAAVAGLYALSGRTAREGRLTQREIGKVRRDAILTQLETRGPTRALDLARALGLPRNLVLHQLRTLRGAKCVRLIGQTQAARWALVAPTRSPTRAADDSTFEIRWSGAAERAGTAPTLTKGCGMGSSLAGTHQVRL